MSHFSPLGVASGVEPIGRKLDDPSKPNADYYKPLLYSLPPNDRTDASMPELAEEEEEAMPLVDNMSDKPSKVHDDQVDHDAPNHVTEKEGHANTCQGEDSFPDISLISSSSEDKDDWFLTDSGDFVAGECTVDSPEQPFCESPASWLFVKLPLEVPQ